MHSSRWQWIYPIGPMFSFLFIYFFTLRGQMFSQALEDSLKHTHKSPSEFRKYAAEHNLSRRRVSVYLRLGECHLNQVKQRMYMYADNMQCTVEILKQLGWKNLYWCPVISTLLRRGSVTQPVYNSPRTLWPHVIHLPICNTATQALII